MPTNPILRPGAPQAPTPPLPIPVDMPSPAEIEAAAADVRSRFSTDHAAAKTAPEKCTLAEQVVSFASTDQPPAVRAAAFQAAIRLAVEAHCVRVGVDAADGMNRFFKLDPAAALVVVDAYAALLKTAQPTDAAALGRGILRFARKAMFREQDTVAEKAASLLVAAAKKSRDPELVKAGKDVARLVEDKAALSAKLSALRAALATSPADPAANLELGALLCFTVGDWQQGLPLLERGGDAALAAVAAADRKAGDTPDAAAGLSLAAAWHDWAVGQHGLRRAAAEGRALDWYLALGADIEASDRDRVAKRIIALKERTRSPGVATALMSVGPAEKTGGDTVLFTKGEFNGAPFTVAGTEWPQAFCYAPKSNGTSILRFELRGSPTRLQGHVGIFSPKLATPDVQPISPLVFTVVGDGKTLWRSRPLGKRDQMAHYSIDVEGVSILELHTTSTGAAHHAQGANYAWGAWLDPELVQ